MFKSCISMILFSIILGSCARTIYVDSQHVVDNKYDSEFPNVPTSEYLEEISNSVKLVNIMVSYRVYDLPPEIRKTAENIDEDEIKKIAMNESYITSPASGTASVIYNYNQRIALITCAHIFNFPDTLTIYQRDNQGKALPYLQSVYFKVEQHITIPGLPEISNYQILVSDLEKDIAVVGKTYKDETMMGFRPFKYPKGYASELRPGTFVFLFGYPRGIQMVSTAIVGQANRDQEHSFIIDAAVHNGISGGPVFALRDGAPNFEMVGMIFAIAGEQMQFLAPDDTRSYETNKQNKYMGDIYLKSARQIVYGITYAKSMEFIEKFFVDNYENFLDMGYNSKFFLTQNISTQ
jgi:Trypsin-like peptidase domain